MFPPTLKPKDYKDLVSSLMANPEIVEAPSGASKLEQSYHNILKTIAQVELQKVQQKRTHGSPFQRMEQRWTSSFYLYTFLPQVFT